MKKQFGPYRRLGRGFFGCSSLWVAETHLLYVKGMGPVLPFSEEYQRYELDRLRGVALVKTKTGLILNCIFGAVLLGCAALAAAAVLAASHFLAERSFFLYFAASAFGAVALVSLVLLVVNTALGPTCLFQVQTPVRIERIRALRRYRPARRALTELGPALARLQSTPERPRPRMISRLYDQAQHPSVA